jgi:hypothetical protein
MENRLTGSKYVVHMINYITYYNTYFCISRCCTKTTCIKEREGLHPNKELPSINKQTKQRITDGIVLMTRCPGDDRGRRGGVVWWLRCLIFDLSIVGLIPVTDLLACDLGQVTLI